MASASERALRRLVRHGTLTVVERGRRTAFGHGAPHATIDVHEPAFWRSLLRGSRGLADAYGDGLWDTPDLAAVIRLAARNMAPIDAARRRLAPLQRPLRIVSGHGGRRRARRAIAAHYDLGNELFSRLLDPTMTYSCAWFERPDETLEEASLAKLDRVCRKLDLRPGDRVLEIGSGWGSFALHAAGRYGCHVTTTTISREQHEFARERVARAGVGDRVTLLLEDYRDVRGRYDKLVSIEMIEAVGWRNFGVFLRRCADLLAPSGSMLLQAITIDDRLYEAEKAARSFINTLIFPDGALPSLSTLARELALGTDLRVVDLEDITRHYPETLRRWRSNLARNADALDRLGYDRRFRRLWELYLAYCEAGFEERRIGDVQLLLGKPGFRAEASGRGAPAREALRAVAG